MSAYTAKLNASIDSEALTRKEAKRRAEIDAARERLMPLEDRVKQFLATVPIELQREGLKLASIRQSLRGRQRAGCQAGELGNALRSLGFERRRNWQRGGDFRALWVLTK